MMKCEILLVMLIAAVSPQVIRFEKCPNFKTQEGFEPAKYFTGRFYEQKRFWTIFEIGAKCVHADYTVNADAMVTVKNSGFKESSGRFSQVGEAYCEKDKPSNCHVRFFPGTPFGDYNVLATDYTSYGLIYTCRETLGGLASLQYAWILTRDKNVTKEKMDEYLAVYKNNGVNLSHFDDVKQDCDDN